MAVASLTYINSMSSLPSLSDALDLLRRQQYGTLVAAGSKAVNPPPWLGLLCSAAQIGLGQSRTGVDRARRYMQQDLTPLSKAAGLSVVGSVLQQHGHRHHATAWFEQAAGLAPEDPSIQAGLARGRVPDYLSPEVAAGGESLLRFSPREVSGGRAEYVYAIDIVGTCNLRCPTCPVGNQELGGRTRGFMSENLLKQILQKIVEERVSGQPQIWLYNWGEPLLHPQLARFIQMINEASLTAHLSSNLNIRHGLKAMLLASPAELKISLSGASQKTYGRTHVRGKWSTVEANMRRISQIIQQHQLSTHVWVGHHVYQHNANEVAQMGELCNELGFGHSPIPAFYQPLEDLVKMGEGGAVSNPVLDLLVEHPASYIARFRKVRDARFDCELRFNQTVINHDGSVSLCCSVYTQDNQLGVGFLDEPHADLQARKYNNDFCRRCYAHGLQSAPSVLHDVQGGDLN